MTIISFPPLDAADENGVLAVGGDLEVQSLLLAYQSGIFPWPFNSEEIVWFAPPKRAVLMFDDFHISRNLRRFINKHDFTIKLDHDFEAVITACAEMRSETWIFPNMIAAYTELFHQGFASNVAVYQNDELVGGIYGVRIKNFFAAESMFHKVDNTSKIALYSLIEKLKEDGLSWLDCQVQNPFLESLGVKEISRNEYMQLLNSVIL